MSKEEELALLQNQLLEVYLSISQAYKRVSKTKSASSQKIVLSGVDQKIRQAVELRDKIESLKKEMLAILNEPGKENHFRT